MLRLIGDVHGKIGEYQKIAKDRTSIQVGDFGFGFVDISPPANAYFIRGNHDSPDLSRMCKPHYLGDYGYKRIGGIDVFFVSGAWSIDWKIRTEGRSWWRDEELSISELENALNFYEQTRPEFVVTHDCPQEAAKMMLPYSLFGAHSSVIPTQTGQALSAMFACHQPIRWIFGHWHYSATFSIGRTEFTCLNELEFLDIPIDKSAG